MRLPALLKTGRRQAVELGAPPAVWQAFQRAGAWKNWTIVVLLGLCVLQTLVAVQLVSRPAEYVLVGSDGKATYVRRGVATDALLRFLADKTKPPELTVVRFTRDCLVLSLGINSATVESNWPAALALMGPDLRGRVEKEAKELGMVGAYKTSGQKTDLQFEDVAIVTQTSNLIHVRATLTRTRPGSPRQAGWARGGRVAYRETVGECSGRDGTQRQGGAVQWPVTVSTLLSRSSGARWLGPPGIRGTSSSVSRSSRGCRSCSPCGPGYTSSARTAASWLLGRSTSYFV